MGASDYAAAQVKEELGRRYAGESLRIAVLRGKERIERKVELAARLEPFQHGFLGILPLRSNSAQGVAVRFVYPQSPAAEAGIAVGDVLVSANGTTVHGRGELAAAVCELEPGNELAVELPPGRPVAQAKGRAGCGAGGPAAAGTSARHERDWGWGSGIGSAKEPRPGLLIPNPQSLIPPRRRRAGC